MYAIVKDRSAYGVSLKKVPVPKPSFGEVLIKVKIASICGTDVHIYNWDSWAQSRIKIPRIIGHEFAGEIVEIGSGVKNLEIGDYVSAETHIYCNQCFQCRTGMKHVCQNTKILGVDVDGAFAEYVVIPAENVWKNTSIIPLDYASLQEPLGNAVDTVLAEGYEGVEGKTVVIFGDGPIGIMCIGISKIFGASKVIVFGRSNYRLDIARKFNPDIAVNSLDLDVVKFIMDYTNGEGVDVVLEASGDPQALREALMIVKPGGRVSILSIYGGDVTLNVNDGIVLKAIRVYGITGRRIWNTWYIVSNILSSGRIDLSPLITHRIKLSDFNKGIEIVKERKCGKVVIYM
ncbi:MAG: L-threonine 3-dehydrogenase [Candidatus Methanomethylicia archaeon]|nr:L-threonine 3-dehydrogenase [Candidatus Methanomethylicia archaeon]